MNAPALDFGSLNQHLSAVAAAKNLASWENEAAGVRREFGSIDQIKIERVQNLLSPAGPVSDAYILGADPVGVINGPGGSGKTTASVKKALHSAQRILPIAGGNYRRYVLGIWRQKYDNLWKTTIPAWWQIFPKEVFPKWQGAPPRAATHTIVFEDGWGPIEITAHFLAFGEIANPEDLKGFQFTDVWLNEFDTLPEELFTYLVDRVGRDPPRELVKRSGRIFGDMNAPDVTNWTYRVLFEEAESQIGRIESKSHPGFVLYRQPGGRSPGAENPSQGPAYYENSARLNADKPWWVRRMVDNIPGVTRGSNLVYPAYADERMRSAQSIPVYRELPVLVGIDNELSPAAVYAQETADGQGRTLAEITLQGQTIEALGHRMLALEAARFPDCEFVDRCDPSMTAGEDAGARSQRMRLSEKLGRTVKPAKSNDPSERRSWVNAKIEGPTLPGDRPSYLLDPSCKAIRRGKLQTFYYRKVQRTDDLGSVAKSFDSHVSEAEQYAYSEMGTSVARKRTTDLRREREKRREKARTQGRYNPLRRSG